MNKLKLVEKKPNLTPKQKAFVDALVRGKTATYKEAYCSAYDVTMNEDNTIPQWVEVEASRLLANPKIALSIQEAYKRKEESSIASSLRTKTYVLQRLYEESEKADSDSARIRALELLGKSVSLFSDVVETKQTRTPEDIEQELENRLRALLEAQETENSEHLEPDDISVET